MAISKRLRFEILRRDGFKCTYCHVAEVLLTVDHVTPRALGGTDHPSNLATCCDDCNTGKSSTLGGALPGRDPFGNYETVISAAAFVWCEQWMPAHQCDPAPELVAHVRQMARKLYPELISAWELLLGAQASGAASGPTLAKVLDLREALETQQQIEGRFRAGVR